MRAFGREDPDHTATVSAAPSINKSKNLVRVFVGPERDTGIRRLTRPACAAHDHTKKKNAYSLRPQTYTRYRICQADVDNFFYLPDRMALVFMAIAAWASSADAVFHCLC